MARIVISPERSNGARLDERMMRAQFELALEFERKLGPLRPYVDLIRVLNEGSDAHLEVTIVTPFNDAKEKVQLVSWSTEIPGVNDWPELAYAWRELRGKLDNIMLTRKTTLDEFKSAIARSTNPFC